jgi:catechol 2,3-dioxygenase-like lactoylglutathione lyase family enzyme
MTEPRIEHVNVTVSDPERAARLMESLFGWHVRWQGAARNGGHTIHVGSDDHYVALYSGRGVTYSA